LLILAPAVAGLACSQQMGRAAAFGL
jgi:hypothetical protein